MSAGNPEATSAVIEADGPGRTSTSTPASMQARTQPVAGVGDERGAGVGDEGDPLASGPLGQLGGEAVLVVLVVGEEGLLYLVVGEQAARAPGVFAGYEVGLAQVRAGRGG